MTMKIPVPVSFEFFPPNTPVGSEKLKTVVRELAACDPEFFSVTYGAGGSTRDKTLATVGDIAALGQGTAVIERLIARPVGEAAAMDPHHHRPLDAVGGGGEDIEVQTVLVLRPAGREAGDEVRRLQGGEALLRRPAHTQPCAGRLGRPEPGLADGRGRVGDAVESHVPAARQALDPTGVRLDRGVERGGVTHGVLPVESHTAP